MTTFKEAVLDTEISTVTENGMKTLESSLNKNIDLFYTIGASRGKDITKAFEAAYLEDREIALRIIQCARDVRGGAGERQLFRDCLLFLEANYKTEFFDTKLIANVAEIGRWDDLLVFKTDFVKSIAYKAITEALWAENGLCAKWMPRKGPVAVALREFMGLSPKEYRKRLVRLTNVVENKMCANEWSDINFSHVPSVAMSRYTKAFARQAQTEFSAYKDALSSGDPSVKINAAAVYPYDVVNIIRHGDEQIADAMWNALPNFMGNSSVLPLVDVSGSMDSKVSPSSNITAMDVAVSLGLYCSDKNAGSFKDLFLTFTSNPTFVHLKGSLSAKVRQMISADWGGSTDVIAAFAEILRVSVEKKVSQEDMPKTLLILSDMQFNQCISFGRWAYGDKAHGPSAMESVREQYEAAGYGVPNIVFWNLRSSDGVPVRFDESGAALVSGFSPSIMKSILANEDGITPLSVMYTAINSTRYDL